MDWLVVLFRDNSVAHSIVILSLVVAVGLAIGSVSVRRVSLGVGGVLFAGLAFGHFGLTLGHETMDFVREFGLILFVYAIGLQVGPSFFSSFRRQGLVLNGLAVAIIAGGTLVAIALALLADLTIPTAVGLLSGAVTNTPSLGAAQQAIKDLHLPGSDGAELVGLGYAVAYPFGIVGTIGTLLLIRKLFRIDVEQEAQQFAQVQHSQVKPIAAKDIEVQNANLRGKTIDQLAELAGPGVVITRVYHQGRQQLATGDTVLDVGDVVHAVGTEARLDNFRVIVGKVSDLELPALPSNITVRRIVVTQRAVVGKSIEELNLTQDYGILITRIVRSGVEFSAMQGLRLQFGDRLVVVGEDRAISRAVPLVGDSVHDLEKPQIVPVFVGIMLGVIVGSWPVMLPHMPVAVKLGLAGGPLIVAILLGRLGKVGPLLVYMPNPAKTLLREFGIALFLAAVGLRAGERFFEIVLAGDGLYWMALAALITVVPLLTVGIVARAWKKINFVSLCGLLSGSVTDPPALAYASQLVKSDAPSISYATVYPMAMLLRVIIAQAIILVAMR